MRGIVFEGVYYKKEKEATKLRMAGGCWTINLDECDITQNNQIVGLAYYSEAGEYLCQADIARDKGFNVPNRMGERKWAIPIKLWTFTAKRTLEDVMEEKTIDQS